jgi:DNA-binding winged helix-turn-helix (wHTH) protein
MAEFGRFGILPDGRRIRLGGDAFDGLTALIEASGAVISEDELLSGVWQMTGSSLRTGSRLQDCRAAQRL